METFREPSPFYVRNLMVTCRRAQRRIDATRGLQAWPGVRARIKSDLARCSQWEHVPGLSAFLQGESDLDLAVQILADAPAPQVALLLRTAGDHFMACLREIDGSDPLLTADIPLHPPPSDLIEHQAWPAAAD